MQSYFGGHDLEKVHAEADQTDMWPQGTVPRWLKIPAQAGAIAKMTRGLALRGATQPRPWCERYDEEATHNGTANAGRG